jgi:four helix bundle protein
MKKHNFKNLKIWLKAMDFTDLAADERYNLIDQINRCSCSISSNIAEGLAREQIYTLQSSYQHR